MSDDPDFLTCLIMLAGDRKIYGSFEIDPEDVEAGVLLVSRFRPGGGRTLAHRIINVKAEGRDFPAIAFPSVPEIVWFVHNYAEMRTRHKINYKALDISSRYGKMSCPARKEYLRIVEIADDNWQNPYGSSEFYGGGE